MANKDGRGPSIWDEFVHDDFANFADFCFKLYGDRVKNWMTFNEPRVVAAQGYDNGIFAPGRCTPHSEFGNCTEGDSTREPYIVAHNLILCHAAAVQRYRERYQRITVERDGVPIGPRANSYWLYIVPWGMYKAMTYIKDHYENPTVILSENGYSMDDPGNVTFPEGLHDTTRINFYKSYLLELKKAIDDGAKVVGYFAWSLLDNFEWRLGYTSRFGLVYVDYNNLKRYPKMSSYWFREMLRRKNN
ncbi:Beta-glucosidase 1 [Acorus gramineus]|uniref:Beta-glucosidase 1 n=1 Tax=Acorus gramineus TaxID=55184 RepID=A0AAV9BXW8_ACOGR|nr:Beta-glucosidase 1 [Acorus gramineus]